MAHEVAAELAAGLVDAALGGELDQVGGLVVVELVRLDQPELDRGAGDALLEVAAVEVEPVAEELDDVVVAGAVVGVASGRGPLSTGPGYQRPSGA